MIVWVVELGEYSDKYVDAVFSIKDNAHAYARTYDGYIYEMDVDPELSEDEKRHLRPGEYAYHVRMTDLGNVEEVREDWGEPKGFLRYNTDSGVLIGECFARSEEHAVKIINDRRTAWLAAGKPLALKKNNYNWYEVEERV